MIEPDRQRQADAILLEMAWQELRWGSNDTRHDQSRWKDEVRKRLWDELQIELEIWT